MTQKTQRHFSFGDCWLNIFNGQTLFMMSNQQCQSTFDKRKKKTTVQEKMVTCMYK